MILLRFTISTVLQSHTLLTDWAIRPHKRNNSTSSAGSPTNLRNQSVLPYLNTSVSQQIRLKNHNQIPTFRNSKKIIFCQSPVCPKNCLSTLQSERCFYCTSKQKCKFFQQKSDVNNQTISDKRKAEHIFCSFLLNLENT